MGIEPVETRRQQPLLNPDGVYWRVNRESFLLLGGGAALLLQVAHPLVAAGVAEHSGFKDEPIRRLYRTIRTMQDIIYEDAATARAAARQVKRVHARVRGTLSEGTPRFPAGTPYRASDPALLLWVHATLLSTALTTYEQFLPRLDREERAAYYEESKTVAAVLGLKPGELPVDAQAFDAYYDDMVRGDVLALTPTVRTLAEQVIHPPISWIPRIAGDALSVATAALLPPPVRDLYGLRWSPRRQFAWRLLRRSLRETLPFMPNRLRAGRHARRGERRARELAA
ncbi:MAG: oxygenase MpaB family protein [Pseudomonadales bacterium]